MKHVTSASVASCAFKGLWHLNSWTAGHIPVFFLLSTHLLQALTTPPPTQIICSLSKSAGRKWHRLTLHYMSTNNNNTYSKAELALVFYTSWRSTPTITPKWQNGPFPPFTGVTSVALSIGGLSTSKCGSYRRAVPSPPSPICRRSSSISVILHHSQTGSSRLASLRHPNTTWFPPGSQKSYVNGSYSSFTVGMGTMHWRGWTQIRMRSPRWTPPNSVRSQHFVFIVILPGYEFRLDVLGCKTPKLAYTGHATRW